MGYAFWLAVAAGAVLPLQALINGRLAESLGGPLPAANVSFLVATLALALLQLVLRQPLPGLAAAGGAPGWSWTGGFLGAIYVAGTMVAIRAIGPTTTVCLVIAGQLAAALAIEQFGVLGAASHPVTLLRALGVALVALGAWLVIRV